MYLLDIVRQTPEKRVNELKDLVVNCKDMVKRRAGDIAGNESQRSKVTQHNVADSAAIKFLWNEVESRREAKGKDTEETSQTVQELLKELTGIFTEENQKLGVGSASHVEPLSASGSQVKPKEGEAGKKGKKKRA